jgi:IclR family acetate operon transcriptional repressor
MRLSGESTGENQAGARAILRVPQVLIEIASSRSGQSLADLSAQLSIPKASLHRIVRTLESGGYLVHDAGIYRLGPNSFHLAGLIVPLAPGRAIPVVARPELERLAEATGETVMLGVLSDDRTEIVYADVIDSKEAVRFTIPVGDRRPLYSVASGKAVLAFLPPDALRAYLGHVAFTAFTPHTTNKEALPGILPAVRASGVAFDDSGRALGASALASPVFDASGKPICAISAAGPTDRIAAQRSHIELVVRKAGERISRVMGYGGAYPPDP